MRKLHVRASGYIRRCWISTRRGMGGRMLSHEEPQWQDKIGTPIPNSAAQAVHSRNFLSHALFDVEKLPARN
jgi:hypothetical protein